MTAAHIILGLSLAIFLAMAVAALIWAARAGQFADSRAGAESIFDVGEPIGKITDAFPKRGIHDPAKSNHATKGSHTP